MIDTLGFHTDTDLHAELATLQRDIDRLTARVTADWFHTPEDRHNTWSHLDNLLFRANSLTKEIAAEDENLNRLADAVRTVGDPDLGFIAYVVFGPTALPMETRYEIRVIDRTGGYSVPGSIRRNVTADQVTETQREALQFAVRHDGRLWGRTIRDYRIQVTAY
ncbi:hypothetical protein [Streptomyces sp. NPDC005407]|uniref:hypothetical protein n=1 Tax=Streptomyces sp. NPDC005407 TaxID=3155340 RepID=UPI0033AEF7C6